MYEIVIVQFFMSENNDFKKTLFIGNVIFYHKENTNFYAKS
jgi:hypothetical protein